MKKILIYAPNALTSGVTNIVYNLHKNMDKSKVCLSVASWPDNTKMSELSKQFNGTFYPFKTYYLRHPFRYKQELIKILDSEQFDVVVFHLSYLLTLFPIITAQKRHFSKIIVYSHSSQIEATSLIKRKILFLFHHINKHKLMKFAVERIACSQNAADWLFGKHSPTTIINNAIDVKHYCYQDTLYFKKKYNVLHKSVIGNVGRLTYPKNQLYLIEICKIYFQMNPNAILWIIGDGPEKETLEKAIKKYNLTEKIFLWGNQQNIPDLLQCMDIFVMPSHFEGAPVALIEAQANGLPCIVSDTISNECIINSNVSFMSISCPPNEWANEIAAKITSKRELAARDNLISKGWDLHNVSQQLQNIYIF